MNLKSTLKQKVLAFFFSIPIILGSVSEVKICATKQDIPTTSQSISKEYKFSDLISLEFETERLTLAPSTEKDLDILAEYLLDKDVSRHLENGAELSFTTKEEALKYLKSKSSDELIDSAEFTIKLKESGTPIGKLDLMLSENSLLSVGYWLGKDFHGMGYMSEACFAVCNTAFNASDIATLYIACSPENKSSIKLANKIFDHIKEHNATIGLALSPMREYTESYTAEGKEFSFIYYAGAIQKN